MRSIAKLHAAAREFLDQSRLAVVGVSRSKDQPANLIYRKLRETGHDVLAVNPNAGTVEGDRCYDSLAAAVAANGPIGGVVIVTHPRISEQVVRECAELGIGRVWLHRSFGAGSVTEPAVELAHERGIEVIAGGCPMMFCAPVDVGHRCMRWVLNLTGGLADAA